MKRGIDFYDEVAKLFERNIDVTTKYQKIFDSLTRGLPSILSEQAEMSAKVQENLGDALLRLNPVLEWEQKNQALFESFNAMTKCWETVVERSRIETDFYSKVYKMAFGLEKYESTNKVWKQFNELIQKLEGASIFDVWRNSGESLFNVVNQVSNEVEVENSLESDEGFSCDEEIYATIEEHANDPVGFQEKIYNWTEKKKRQYYIVYIVILFLFGNIVLPYFQENIGKKVMAWSVAHVRELPEMAGKCITNLKEEVEAMIIENCPYYYKVSFIDENGEQKEGYVSKRSVKLIEVETEESEESGE